MADTLSITEITGDTWDGALVTVTDEDTGLPVSLLGATITTKLRDSTGAVVYTFDVGTGHTITDGAGGVFAFDETDFALTAGTYYGATRITLASGRKKTWLAVNLTLLEDPNRA